MIDTFTAVSLLATAFATGMVTGLAARLISARR